jgi:hypothetical protein
LEWRVAKRLRAELRRLKRRQELLGVTGSMC